MKKWQKWHSKCNKLRMISHFVAHDFSICSTWLLNLLQRNKLRMISHTLCFLLTHFVSFSHTLFHRTNEYLFLISLIERHWFVRWQSVSLSYSHNFTNEFLARISHTLCVIVQMNISHSLLYAASVRAPPKSSMSRTNFSHNVTNEFLARISHTLCFIVQMNISHSLSYSASVRAPPKSIPSMYKAQYFWYSVFHHIIYTIYLVKFGISESTHKSISKALPVAARCIVNRCNRCILRCGQCLRVWTTRKCVGICVCVCACVCMCVCICVCVCMC